MDKKCSENESVKNYVLLRFLFSKLYRNTAVVPFDTRLAHVGHIIYTRASFGNGITV